MNKRRIGFISVITSVAVIAIGTVIYFQSSGVTLPKYYSKAIIKNVDEKSQAVVVDGYKVQYSLSLKTLKAEGPTSVVFDKQTKIYKTNGNNKENIALDQLKPNQTIDIVYEYPNDHLVRASEISVVSND